MTGEAFIEIGDGDVTWRFERDFMTSGWTCIFGGGCEGILPERAAARSEGCCSYGAHLGDGDDGRAEALDVAALAATLSAEQWQYRTVLDDGPGALFADDRREHTRVIDGACVFLNRPGFARGPGCALHVGAIDAGEAPSDWKPSVCWQLPIRVDWAVAGEAEVATVRRWRRSDWGGFADTMAWCCTERAEGGEAFVGTAIVADTLHAELTKLVGEPVYVELRRRIGDATTETFKNS